MNSLSDVAAALAERPASPPRRLLAPADFQPVDEAAAGVTAAAKRSPAQLHVDALDKTRHNLAEAEALFERVIASLNMRKPMPIDRITEPRGSPEYREFMHAIIGADTQIVPMSDRMLQLATELDLIFRIKYPPQGTV